MISARDFVDLLRIYKHKSDSIQIASTSIERNDMPKNKGFVRGTVVLSGVLFEKMGAVDIQKHKLPKLMCKSADDENESVCDWTRIRYIVQTDIKGWIPSSVINTAMSSTNVGMLQ